MRLKTPKPAGDLRLWIPAWCALPVCVLCAGILAVAQSQPGQGTAALQRADTAFRAGYAAMQAGHAEEARADFAEAVRLAPKLPEARIALGAILLQLGRPAEAIPELQKALTLRPGDAVALQNLSAAHDALALKLAAEGKLTAAGDEIKAALAAMEAMPKSPEQTARKAELQDEAGSVLAQQKRWAQAEDAFREALRLNPQLGAGAHMHLGVVLVQEKQLEAGLAELTTALQLAPGNAAVEYELGVAFSSAGRDEEAVPHLEAAFKARPDLPGGALELAMALQRLGKQDESIPLFQRALAADANSSLALTNLGLALTETGKAKDAVPYLERALELTPQDPVVLEDLAVAELQQSHFDEAIARFGKALALDENNPQLHYDLGLAYKLKDQNDNAIRELLAAERLGPSLPDPPYTLGILYMQLGKQEEAVTQLQAALALRPDNGDGWATLGSVLKQMDRKAEAEAALRKAVELQPNQPGAHITLAGVLAEQGKTQEAAAERKIAAGLSRTAVNRQRAMLNTNAGNQSLQRGEIAEAVSRYQEAIVADPAYTEAHQQLALAYERQGRTAEAAVERAKSGTQPGVNPDAKPEPKTKE